MSDSVIAVDIGGGSIRGALIGVDGTQHHTSAQPSSVGETAFEHTVLVILDLISAARTCGLSVAAIGVVTPGILDDDAGLVRYASNLQWREFPLRDRLRDVVGVPVAIGNDSRSAGIAEGVFGIARGVADYLHISVGTGVAASIVSGGRSQAGGTGAAGELGHVPVWPDGELCACGQRGCLEAYFSGRGLALRYFERTGVQWTAKQIAQAADSDRAAGAVWQEGVRTLALGVASATLLCDPSMVVLAGGVSLAGERLFSPLRRDVQAALNWRAAPQIVGTLLGSRAAQLGAAIVAMRECGKADLLDWWPRQVNAGWDVAARAEYGRFES